MPSILYHKIGITDDARAECWLSIDMIACHFEQQGWINPPLGVAWGVKGIFKSFGSLSPYTIHSNSLCTIHYDLHEKILYLTMLHMYLYFVLVHLCAMVQSIIPQSTMLMWCTEFGWIYSLMLPCLAASPRAWLLHWALSDHRIRDFQEPGDIGSGLEVSRHIVLLRRVVALHKYLLHDVYIHGMCE